MSSQGPLGRKKEGRGDKRDRRPPCTWLDRLCVYSGIMCRPAESPKAQKGWEAESQAIEEAKKYQLVAGEQLYCEGALRPTWRGVLHQYSFFLLPVPLYFLLGEVDTITELLATLQFFATSGLLFLCSYLYHRVDWSPAAEVLAQKVDHCGIFVATAGNVTAMSLLAMRTSGPWVLTLAWLACLWGVVNILTCNKQLHHFVMAGSVVLCGFHEIVVTCTPLEVLLLVLSWVQLGLGLALYASGKPVLWPQHFSAHEVMHLLVSTSIATTLYLLYSLLRRFDVTDCWFITIANNDSHNYYSAAALAGGLQ